MAMTAAEGKHGVPFQDECKKCGKVVSRHLPRVNSIPNGIKIKVRCRGCGTTNNLGVGYVE